MNLGDRTYLAQEVLSITRDPKFSNIVESLFTNVRQSNRLPEYPAPPPPPPGSIFRTSRGESEGAPRHARADPPVPSHGSSHYPARGDDDPRSEPRTRALFSKGGSVSSNPVHRALAVLSQDETFRPVAVLPYREQDFVNEVERGSYDPNTAAAEGIQRNSLYLLMKNDVLQSAKSVENLMTSAAYIWKNIYKVSLPMIRLPINSGDSVLFKMKSLDDKLQVLSMSQNEALRREQKLHFMGKPTHVEDVSVLPWLMALPGTRQEALDALMPLRSIPYEDQLQARAESIRSMLKNVVLSARMSLQLPLGAPSPLAGCFFDEPELLNMVGLPELSSMSFPQFTTVELGPHPSTEEPVAGARVYYGPEEAPLVYLLPFEDCVHINLFILKAAKDLFDFLLYEGFSVYNSKAQFNRGDLLRFRVLMSTSGKMIFTVELALDDKFVGSFEEIVTQDTTDPSLFTCPRLLYQPVQEPPVIADYPFMKENSLDEGPPSRDLLNYGGVEQLRRIRPALQKYFHEYGSSVGIEGIYVTWYYVSERPVQWSRHSKIWHLACGAGFVSEVILNVTLPMYPHICSPHFPHTEAFPKLLWEIVNITRVGKNSRVIILSEYLFLAEFFGQKCLRTIFLKNETTLNERDYLERTLPSGAIKFLSPSSNPSVELLEPGGDVVIIWGGNRLDEVLRNIGLADYKTVIYVRDGLKREKQDKYHTFTSLCQIAKCLFPYMALKGAVAFDVEPQGNTMPALINLFSKAPHAPRMTDLSLGAPLQPVVPQRTLGVNQNARPDYGFSSNLGFGRNGPPRNDGSARDYGIQRHEGPPRDSYRDGFGSQLREGPPSGFGRNGPPGGAREGLDFGFRRGEGPPRGPYRGGFGSQPREGPPLGFGRNGPPGDARGGRNFGFQRGVYPPRDARGGHGFVLDRSRDQSADPKINYQLEKMDPSHSKMEKVCQYIIDMGGPDLIETMPLPDPDKLEGAMLLTALRKCIANQKANGGVRELPRWYNTFLVTNGYPIPYDLVEPHRKQVLLDAAVQRPQESVGEDKRKATVKNARSDCPPQKLPPDHVQSKQSPNKNLAARSSITVQLPERNHPVKQPSLQTAQLLMKHIMENGGPHAVETMPLPDDNSGRRYMLRLQKSIRNQLHTVSGCFKVMQLPHWYMNLLLESGFHLRELYPHLKEHSTHNVSSIQPSPSAGNQAPVLNDGVSQPTNVTSDSEPPAKIRKLENEVPSGVPSGPDPEPVTTGAARRTDFFADLTPICEYIKKNGGHANVATMAVDETVEGWQLLNKTQKQIRRQINMGADVIYRGWYRTAYLSKYEPEVVAEEPATN